MLFFKLAVSVILLLGILASEFLFVALMAKTRAALKPKVQNGIDSFMGRRNRRRRLQVAFYKGYKYASKPLAMCTVFSMACVAIYALYVSSHTGSPEAWIASRLTLIFTAVASLACISISGKNILSFYFSSTWARTVWAVLAGTMFWLGSIHTKADLNWNYGAVANQMSATVQAGAVLRGIGELSVLFFIPILLLEVAFLLALGDTRRRKDKVYQQRRRRFLVTVYSAFLLTDMGLNSGLDLAANSAIFEAFETDMAWSADAYPTSACTGTDSGKTQRVIFTNSASSQAIIFGESESPNRRVGRWQPGDVAKSRMKFIRVAACLKESP